MPVPTSHYHSTLLLNGDDPEAKRLEIKEYFNQTYRLYESLFDTINTDDAYFIKAEPLRHPLIFYYGHTACFFVNKLKLSQLIQERVNGHFESMFAIGVDEMSWDDLDETHYDWPSRQAVAAYREQVEVLVNHVIDTMPISLPIQQDDPAWIILMGIEHERIHLETSSVIIRQLPIEMVTDHPAWPSYTESQRAPDNVLVDIAGSTLTLGKGTQEQTYGWDNEYGTLDVTVLDFKASKYLVSNQEYLSFVEAGGYQDSQYWDEEGTKWLAFTQAKMPRFWLFREGQYWQRNLTTIIPLPLDWPVEVNQLEAAAFCRWLSEKHQKAIRLPEESEWYALRNLLDETSTGEIDLEGNIALKAYASSMPVNHFQQGELFDVVGNVWQWTQTAIDGFNGFQVHPMYDDFSTPTFDGQHNLIKGGSWISTGNEATRSSRYAFRRHFYQHAGFRYVEAESTPSAQKKVNVYETDELVSQYLEFHYGNEYFGVPNFPLSVVTTALGNEAVQQKRKALDIGCSVGRASFELARHFDHVDGIDFSARFIQQAYALSERGETRYTIPTEGELVEYKNIALTQLGYEASIGQKIHFAQGDACNLKPMFKDYDLILAANLIDRLSEPHKFLNDMAHRLNPGGILVIVSPYTWLEDYTEKENWVGGKKINGENHTSFEGLSDILSPHFTLLEAKDIPFVIRETKRKFQHTLSHFSLWQRNAD
ncbi:5-histidylcysteine sulfoxide synthase [Thaumasiovibrio subtropicus]|uniref:5-histidylcysteine sulfoxide synthase n=1 Tax=Thaumasiovibrio subtropicus TaxID=1891207 RepID=UPI000B351CAA|nr:5-histidylcysteine sulfoxide synthase [Thaumasiovibrio subtropicus]